MEEIKIKGVVIKASDYKDSDKIVTIFYAEKGLINARVRGVKKNKAKLAFAVQPFAFVDFLLVKKGDFYTVINASSIDQFFNITTDFDKFVFMTAVLEIIQKTMKENDLSTDMFLLLLGTLKFVCYREISPMVSFIKFMLEAMKILGFKIEVQNCVCCGNLLTNQNFAFSYDYNGIICSKCQKNAVFLELSNSEFKILNQIDKVSFDNLETIINFERNDLVSVISLLCKDFRLCVDEEILSIKKFL